MTGAQKNAVMMEAWETYVRAFGSVPKGWIVYHVNGDITDNAPANLVAIPPVVYNAIRLCKVKPTRGQLSDVARRYGRLKASEGSRDIRQRIADRLLIQSALREALRHYPKHKRLRTVGKSRSLKRPGQCGKRDGAISSSPKALTTSGCAAIRHGEMEGP